MQWFKRLDVWSVVIGATLLAMGGVFGTYALNADNFRRADAEYTKRQLAEALDKIEIVHRTTQERFNKLESMLLKKKVEDIEKLMKEAEQHIFNLRDKSTSTKEFGESLHSGAWWEQECRRVVGNVQCAPRATAGSKALIDYYTTHTAMLRVERDFFKEPQALARN